MGKYTSYTIENNSKSVKRMRTLLIVLLVISILAFLVNVGGTYTAEQDRKNAGEAKKAAKQVELVVTGKVNSNASVSRLVFDFSLDITNNGSKAVNYIEGVFNIMDKSGNVLSTGTASFGSDYMNTTELGYNFPAGTTQKYTLEWRSDQTEDSVKLWESAFSDLTFSFEITRLRVENNTTVDVK